mgnify:CR=1 FL=1
MAAPRALDEVLGVIVRPLDLERRHGYKNASVVGGLSAYVSRHAGQAIDLAGSPESVQGLLELRALFGDYDALSSKQRQARVEKALAIVGAIEATPQSAGSAVVGPASAAEAQATAPSPVRPERPEAPVGRGDGWMGPPPSERTVYVAVSDAERAAGGGRVRVEQPTVTVQHAKALQKAAHHARGVGPGLARLLDRISLRTLEDLLWNLPRRHEDRRRMARIRDLREGDVVAILGRITSTSFFQPPRRPKMSIFKVTVSDGTGHVQMVFFNRPYLRSVLKKDMTLLVNGKVERPKKGALKVLVMNGPEYEELGGDDDTIHVGRIVPVYGLTEGLMQRKMRTVMKHVIDDHAGGVPDVLPPTIRRAQSFPSRAQALAQAHFPDTPEAHAIALEALVFEELFVMQVGLALRRREAERVPRQGRYDLDPGAIDRFTTGLPFPPTDAQHRVMREVRDDLMSPVPMSRLVQGDVGSGKTVIAAFAAWCAIQSGFQAAIMAPTEILAEQLSRKIQDLIGHQYNVCLLTGSLNARQRDRALEGLAEGSMHVAVGTHALIQEDVRFHSLGLVVIDEQHKFGVVQRSTLRNKGYNPDVLVMTATPIPRTLSLTLYGDLETSVIDQLPAGRSPIRSFWRPTEKLDAVYDFIEKQLEEGRQAYVVCPLVEESEKLEAASATAEAQRVAERFPHRRVGLLHGRMKSDEKDQVMERFRACEYHILVSTTVVEVGVDVPNATVMVVQNADRFGLAQLHQLRGRVGRGQHQSYCVFIADPTSEEGVERMQVISSTTDGFKIAEEDLRFRGPGDFIGSRQSGLPDLRVADLVRDKAILERARLTARDLIGCDPFLAAIECQQLKDEVRRCFSGQFTSLLS